MTAILTRLGIATVLFTFIMAFTVIFMVDMGTQYNATPDYYLETITNENYVNRGSELASLSFNSSQKLLKEGIDNQASDSAQLGGGFDGSNNQLSAMNILMGTLQVIPRIITLDNELWTILVNGLLTVFALSISLYIIFRVII